MYIKEELNNGVSLVTAQISGTQAVTVMVYVKTGSRFENPEEAGIAHFIEHLLFKGTHKRPTTLDISKELDSVGAEYNAFTSKDYTGFYIKLKAEKIELALDMLSDMLFNSTLKQEEIDKEKGVIIEEINMYEDMPMYLTEEFFESKLYGQNPLARNVLGTKDSITSMSRKQILHFYNRFYQQGRLVVSISGRLPDNCSVLTNKYFNKKKNIEKSFLRVDDPAWENNVNIYYKKTEQVHLALGLPLELQYDHPDIYKFKLANIIFGGSMSSRLFINIREKQGLCYYINSGLNLYEDTANWAVYAGVDQERVERAVELIKSEWLNLAKGISAAEFAQAKEYFKGKLVLRFEDSAQVAQWFGKQELFGLDLDDPEAILKKIDDLSQEEINEILSKIIKSQSLMLAVVGPFKDKNKFNQFAKIKK